MQKKGSFPCAVHDKGRAGQVEWSPHNTLKGLAGRERVCETVSGRINDIRRAH